MDRREMIWKTISYGMGRMALVFELEIRGLGRYLSRVVVVTIVILCATLGATPMDSWRNSEKRKALDRSSCQHVAV